MSLAAMPIRRFFLALALLLAGAGAAAQSPLQAAGPNPSDATFRAVAASMGTDAGIDYRYGPAATDTLHGLPTWPKRPDQSYSPVSVRLPNGGDRSCVPPNCGTWSIGGPLTMGSGDFSSSIINIAYVPDEKPAASFYAKRYFGVASLQQIGIAHNAVAVKPEPSWTVYNGPAHDNGSNDESIERYASTEPDKEFNWKPAGIDLDRPVAIGKCYGRGGWCTNSLAVFASGWIASVGSNTARNKMVMKLPADMVPTAITVTNSGEFALVSVMNTRTLTAQVAVFALADGCEGCPPNDESKWYGNWGNHRRVYYGLPGLGNFVAGKYIGAVDLPPSLRLPTEISASTGHASGDYEHERNFWNDNIENEANRIRYRDDPWLTEAIARTGMAVVISKSERRAAFIDLRPLFDFYRRSYFTSSRSQFDAIMANRGDGADQWPYTFEREASQRPRVIKVMDLPQPPTAVRMSLAAPFRAFIATQEGALRVFDLGTRYLDQVGTQVGQPGDIVPRFNVKVGRNPTSIAYVRDHGWESGSRLFKPARPEQFMIVASRVDRSIQWVEFDRGFNQARIFKTLQDSRIQDPIAVEDAANHGTESYVVTVADYNARTVRNYLYGPIILWTYDGNSACKKPVGCSLLNNGAFEYGGDFELPGRPFQMGGSNIN